MAMKIQVMIFWAVTPCSEVVGNHCFGLPCFLHLQGEDGSHVATSQGTTTSIFIAMKITSPKTFLRS
jgi:hypothetical protein